MVYKRITSSRRNQKRGCRKWLTFDQLLEVFKSKSVVEALVQRKMSDKTLRRTEVRNHPEVPGLKQYLVLVDDEEIDENTVQIDDIFELEAKEKLKKGSRSSGSGSSDDDDSNDDDASSASAKKGKKDRDMCIYLYVIIYILYNIIDTYYFHVLRNFPRKARKQGKPKKTRRRKRRKSMPGDPRRRKPVRRKPKIRRRRSESGRS
ncbi:unnamed protein product [Symbiodinium pilosum]|uniref:Uncharacterized protein n=1 Tax=Symbiodinium pilosum TaxID=2952 RepID=A0A812MXI5_SYMPI|nr:unnamed protein product [Symbiodinium pilosum]